MTEALGFYAGNAKGTEEMKHIDSTSRKVIVAKTIHDWPAGYHTKSYWKYECDRRIRKGSKPTIVEIEDRSDTRLPPLADLRLDEEAIRTATGSARVPAAVLALCPPRSISLLR